MLDRLATYAGCPTGHIGYLSLPNEVLLLYHSVDTTVILNARTLNLVRVLAFWEAFPSLKFTNDKITCISVDTGHKLVVVAMNSRIAAWSLSGVKQDVWRIHSTLVLPKDQSIITLDSRSGLLAIGTQNGLSVYNSVLENDLPTWSKKWSIKCPTPSLVSFAPSLMYIVAASKVRRNSNIIRIYSTTTGKQTQVIPHPRPVVNLRWRQSQASSRDDMILYTVTSDSVLRIFLPVLDAPRTLQLHASLDLFSSLPFSFASMYPDTNSVVWLSGELINSVFSRILKAHQDIDGALIRLIKDVVEEKWELFLRVLPDGSIVVSAVANIDCRPPTLLQQFTLKHTPPHALSTSSLPTQILLLPNPDPCMFTLVTSSPLRTYDISPLEFFGPLSTSDSFSTPSSPAIPTSGSPVRSKSMPAGTHRRTRTATGITTKEQDRLLDRINEKGEDPTSTGLELLVKGMDSVKHEKKAIERFLRTSEGHGVAVLRKGGCGEVWQVARRSGSTGEKDRLVHQADFEDADFVVVLDQGYSFVTYSATTELLTLHSKYPQKQTHTLSVPKLESLFTYPSATPSNTADNHSKYSRESIFGITPDCYIVHVCIDTETGKLVLHSHRRLPVLPPPPPTSRMLSSSSPSISNATLAIVNGGEGSNKSHHELMNGTDPDAIKRILPVDPMAWGWDPEHDGSLSSQLNLTNADAKNESNVFKPAPRNGRGGWEEHDVLLSVSEGGELAFWVPDSTNNNKDARNGQKQESGSSWRCTGRVRTGRTGFNRVRCSSAKKTALVVPSSEGDEVTIWDSMESEFASGLEYRGIFDESVLDLDWNSTPDMQSILAVGFSRHIEVLCQQRMTYFDEGPGWALCHRIDITSYTPYPISDSIWLLHASFLVGSGHQMWLYGEPAGIKKRKSIDAFDRRTDSVPDEDEEIVGENLFEYVARQNGPLEDYHPQMLLQCLLWGKVELVKEIITNLAKAIKMDQEAATMKGRKILWTPLPAERFLENNVESRASKVVTSRKQYNLFAANNQTSELEGEFSRVLVTNLIETLELNPIPHLTPNEHAHLLVLIQTTLDIDEQRRALDANGLRYLISMRSFYILNRLATAPTTPNLKGRFDDDNPAGAANGIPRQTGKRERLRYRDMTWAFHSESQELLVGACTAACNGKMVWSDARALGFPVWLNSIESLKTQMENIARNEYMAGDNRDPVACSLYYFALGKSKLVHGLWRQAAWHKEQNVMLKFLANDFSQPKWKTAALKNAYALMGRRRFEYAAAFFLLGGALKDAVNVCIRQLDDWQMAVALARIVENSNEGPVFKSILRDTILSIAFQTGNRWLGSWAFWLLHRRDLSVRILLTPLQDIAAAFGIMVEEIGEPHYDDPGLALLFAQLRSKTLQAAKGTSEISGRSEFNFVLQMARVFCRMGCHVLALDLVRSWSFERPSIQPETRDKSAPPSPTVTRRPMFPLEPAMRRRSSILIDMDILSLPPTRSESPDRDLKRVPLTNGTIKEESDLFARKAGLGNLMKTAKQDVQVPEFDMNAFF